MSAEWMDQAACLGEDPDRMQPEVATDDEVAQTIADNCARCPVMEECAQLAVSQVPGAFGIHGGQWFGEPPKRPGAAHCGWCGRVMASERSTSRYCGGACRVNAYRARQVVPA